MKLGISGICMQTSSGWESVPSTSFDGPNSKSAPGTSITEYNPEGISGICMQTSSGRESVPSTSFDAPNSKSAPGTSIAEYNPEGNSVFCCVLNTRVLRVMKMNETAFIPTRATFESAGWDIRTPFDLCIPARERLLVDSLLKMKLPTETYDLVWP
ncbi:hypothetical protein JTB14_036062 [Gonioctena quinquepunctata]|nr:hypothetical protein JTB14_036062 [Gonioctena quinquepunctata]